MEPQTAWKVVFDASTDSWHGLQFGTAMLGIALVISAVGVCFDKLNGRRIFSSKTRFISAFMLFCSIAALVSGHSQYRALRGALERGDYRIVEGVVDRFVPAAQWGSWESFVVGNHEYEYSDSWLVPGYHRTASNGGLIRSGLRIRIADVDGQIARLEVQRGG